MARDPTTGKDLSRLQDGLFWYESLEIFNGTMRGVAQSDHVFLIDLARLMPKDTKYYWDPVHFTDAGAAEVGRIATAGLLPYLEREFPSYDRGTCEIDFTHRG